MSVKFKIIYALFILILTIFTVELGSAYYLNSVLEKATEKKFKFDSYRVYGHQPGFREGDNEGDWIIFNSQGFRRDEEVSLVKPEGTFRAFLMGGSTAAGVSAPPPYPIAHVYMDETIDAHLERMLEKAFPNKHIEIINVAAAGYQVFQHTSYLLSELLNYDPDLVIFLDGANDHYRFNPQIDYYLDFKYQFWSPRLKEPNLGGLWDYFAHYMADYSAFFRGYFAWKLQHDARIRDADPRFKFEAESDQEIIGGYRIASEKGYLRSTQVNIDILKREGIDVILSLQPALNLRNKNLLSDVESSFYRGRGDVSDLLYPLIKEDLEKLAFQNAVGFVDLVPIFNDQRYAKKQLFIDYVHVNDSGGKIIAEALFNLASPLVEKP
ncbi:MAG: SGNH/GDSL hydrolase family protein [Marinibacterium sp.]|nr:SGNH/GDSL hydrolase family protein [Marinibacterium sp.]